MAGLMAERHAEDNWELIEMDETRQYDVALAECRSYEDETVETALRSALQTINGLDFVKPGMRIAVKTNLVTAMKPETAATVHPAVICALTRILRELGAEVVFGDGPGGIYSSAYLKVVYDVCGLRKAEQYGGKLNDDFSVTDVVFPVRSWQSSFRILHIWQTRMQSSISANSRHME